MEMARCMLGNLPSFLWGEAIHTAIHTLNRCITKAVEGKTPYEAWTGKKPNISHFRIFDCDALPLLFQRKKRNWIRSKKNTSLWATIISIEVTVSTLHPINHYLFLGMSSSMNFLKNQLLILRCLI